MIRKIGLKGQIALLLYDSVIRVAIGLAYALVVFRPRYRRYLIGRAPSCETLRDTRNTENSGTKVLVFFCSSAGEYEQARPLIDRLLTDARNVHVFFHSPSGVRYAHTQAPSHSFSLAPFDRYHSWRKIFAKLRPDLTVVVRNEFWPGFFAAAREYSRLYIIDVTLSQGLGWNQRLKRKFLLAADQLFLVDSKVRAFYRLGSRALVAGDTKYDRVMERSAQETVFVARLRSNLLACFPSKKRFILGNAYWPDIRLALVAHRNLPGCLREGWQVIIVPHFVDKRSIDEIMSYCSGLDFKICLYSQLRGETPDRDAILIVDSVGRLADFYGISDLALVGGGFCVGVHNILEPLAYGLPLTFGPRYGCQMEAEFFVKKGLVRPVNNTEDLTGWWMENAGRARTQSALKPMSGAADLIYSSISAELQDSKAAV
jgi:3-deoxy-D-manno-octulosonic-acid transferase